MTCIDKRATCRAAISTDGDMRLIGTEPKTYFNAFRSTVPLLATLRCPRCRGPAGHLITREIPSEFLCGRCGSVMACDVES
jgi:hypothetical protein